MAVDRRRASCHSGYRRRVGVKTVKLALARVDLFPAPSTAVSSARYGPGVSGLLLMRPEKGVLFAPAVARASKEPMRLKRVHLGLRAFDRVLVRHLPLTLRPLVLRSMVNVTVAGSESL